MWQIEQKQGQYMKEMGLAFARLNFVRNQEFLCISIALYFGKEKWMRPTNPILVGSCLHSLSSTVKLSSRRHCYSSKQIEEVSALRHHHSAQWLFFLAFFFLGLFPKDLREINICINLNMVFVLSQVSYLKPFNI